MSCYRWGEEMDYWGGAISGQNVGQVTCGCWMDKSCEDPNKLCNCDNQVTKITIYTIYAMILHLFQ